MARHKFDFAIDVPCCFVQVFEILRGVFASGTAQVFHGIAGAKVEMFGDVDDFMSIKIVGIICGVIYGVRHGWVRTFREGWM